MDDEMTDHENTALVQPRRKNWHLRDEQPSQPSEKLHLDEMVQWCDHSMPRMEMLWLGTSAFQMDHLPHAPVARCE
jgi:hypothetical protein